MNLSNRIETIKVALPTKGSYSEDACRLMETAGFICRRKGRQLVVVDSERNVEFYYLKFSDIARFVGQGYLDIGVIGQDLICDSELPVYEVLLLGFEKVTWHYFCSKKNNRALFEYEAPNIATQHKNIVTKDMVRRGLKGTIIHMNGSVEIAIRLGIADLVADLLCSGETTDENGLKAIGDPIMTSSLVLAARNPREFLSTSVNTFIDQVGNVLNLWQPTIKAHILRRY